jgi:putative DNA primase/helicase
MLNTVYEYVEKGWSVFPLHGIKEDGECTCGRIACPDSGKHPLTKNGLKNASNKMEEVKTMFDNLKTFNIGVRTGKVSGITIIDIDVGEGKLGAESWSELIQDKGEPNTLMSKTGGGGMHVFFRYNSALKQGTNRLGKGIDVRNDGGYIVAPPSSHRSGGTYEWQNEGTPLDDLPEYLLAPKKKSKRDPTRRKYSIEEVRTMLEKIPSNNRDDWRNFGVILGREFNRSDEAWALYVEWAAKDEGKRGRNHDENMREAFYEISQDTTAGKELSMGTIYHLAIENGWVPKSGLVSIDNFIYFAPGNNFVYESANGSCSFTKY